MAQLYKAELVARVIDSFARIVVEGEILDSLHMRLACSHNHLIVHSLLSCLVRINNNLFKQMKLVQVDSHYIIGEGQDKKSQNNLGAVLA